MKIPDDVSARFMAGESTERTRFGYNAPVRIVAGPLAGRSAAVISIWALLPAVIYFVERDDGKDAHVPQDELRAI